MSFSLRDIKDEEIEKLKDYLARKKCKLCKHPNRRWEIDGYIFCPYCGRKLKG